MDACFDVLVVGIDPNLLQCNNVVVRLRKLGGYGCDAFVSMLGNELKAPAGLLSLGGSSRQISERTSNLN
jgi:hypothetical protein